MAQAFIPHFFPQVIFITAKMKVMQSILIISMVVMVTSASNPLLQRASLAFDWGFIRDGMGAWTGCRCVRMTAGKYGNCKERNNKNGFTFCHVREKRCWEWKDPNFILFGINFTLCGKPVGEGLPKYIHLDPSKDISE